MKLINNEKMYNNTFKSHIINGDKMKEKEVILKLYHNVLMGVIGIETIENKIENRSLRKTILNQKKEYEAMEKEMFNLCVSYNITNKEISPMAKISSEVMGKMKIMMDNTDHNIAKMMMDGTNKGLIELETLQNNYNGTDEDIKKMITKIIEIEQQNNEDLKIYL